MSTNDIDIENQSAIAAPSPQPEIQESVPMAVPEDPQSQEQQYNERGDTGGKYPYIDKIIELSETEARYEAQARKWQYELNLTPRSEINDFETYTATFDQLFGYIERSRECGNPCCYNLYCQGCVESPICAIFDFTSDDNLSAQSFTNTEIEDKFCEALEAPSSNVKTRIILVTLWNTSQTSEVNPHDIPPKTDFWPNMPGAKLTNFLGTKYDLDPLFYDQIMSDRERDFWKKGQGHGERQKSSTRYNFMKQIEPIYLLLGFNDVAIWEVAPRLWGVMKIGCPGPDQKTAIEDFQIILDQIDDYSDRLTSETANAESKKLNFFMKRCRRTLSRARLSEQYLRDKIQINVGTLSLEESRKSIQQANSIGRIYFFGFVFLPLSLVMSFYGMNINEIPG
ncbi:hypothetical protein HYALB_00004707 [Hymenoscyphus albidus]|uniref:Uncharacterized protein n=1 Tax=Hymenoscyphus albidus TaxID=595503 RepID=A0A9N9Q6L2_9HELO|nr:hypothetical protein HYALB_00004707 [Hymenoscyphus albidus]